MRKENLNATKKTILTRNRVRKFRKKKAILKQRERSIQNQLARNDVDLETNFESKPQDDASDSLLQKLREWAISHRITARAINDLLKILICCGFSWLPADYRAFLDTPRNVQLSSVANGQFWYNGIAKNLEHIFSNLDRDLNISLNFNVDGLPLFKSSKKAFWPILASIHGKKNI